MKRLIPLFAVLFMFSQSPAQPEDEQAEETVVTTSCSLSVKTIVYNPEAGDVVGKASVQAFLCDKGGIPIPNQPIDMTSTGGTFTCIPPDGMGSANTTDRSCFVTGSDGTIQVYLVDIPFNKPGKIKATCTYGDFTVHATGNYSITRNITRKKKK